MPYSPSGPPFPPPPPHRPHPGRTPAQMFSAEQYLSALELAEAAVEEGRKLWAAGVKHGYLLASKQVTQASAPSPAVDVQRVGGLRSAGSLAGDASDRASRRRSGPRPPGSRGCMPPAWVSRPGDSNERGGGAHALALEVPRPPAFRRPLRDGGRALRRAFRGFFLVVGVSW